MTRCECCNADLTKEEKFEWYIAESDMILYLCDPCDNHQKEFGEIL